MRLAQAFLLKPALTECGRLIYSTADSTIKTADSTIKTADSTIKTGNEMGAYIFLSPHFITYPTYFLRPSLPVLPDASMLDEKSAPGSPFFLVPTPRNSIVFRRHEACSRAGAQSFAPQPQSLSFPSVHFQP